MKKYVVSILACLLIAVGGSFLFFSHPDVQYQYELTICAMFKNEAPWLKEWIVFHHDVLGFEHFYLYNNDSTDNYNEVLHPFVEKGIVELIDWNSADPAHRFNEEPIWLPYQIGAYNDCLKNRALGKAKWVAMIDIDEFIVPVHGAESLRPFLRAFTKQNRGAVNFSWRCFGTSNVLELNSGELLTEKLISRAPDQYKLNNWVKSMYRPEAVSFCHIHEAPGKLNPPFRKRHAKSTEFRIHHYWTRTESCCSSKRGLKKPQDEALLNELNSVEDRTMEQYIPALKKALNQYQ
jgi:hypothetical protein